MQADDSTKGGVREPSAACARRTPVEYEIRVSGHLDPRWATWFDGMDVINADDGTTSIHGPVVDQAALHGLLQKLRDVGVPLISLTPVEPDH